MFVSCLCYRKLETTAFFFGTGYGPRPSPKAKWYGCIILSDAFDLIDLYLRRTTYSLYLLAWEARWFPLRQQYWSVQRTVWYTAPCEQVPVRTIYILSIISQHSLLTSLSSEMFLRSVRRFAWYHVPDRGSPSTWERPFCWFHQPWRCYRDFHPIWSAKASSHDLWCYHYSLTIPLCADIVVMDSWQLF